MPLVERLRERGIKVLHDKKLLGKNASRPKLFKRFPDHFELQPATQPNQVRFIPAAA